MVIRKMNPKNNSRIDDFALPDDLMSLNTLIIRIAKEKEVFIHTVSGKEWVGFVTGLDHESIQITTTKDQRLVVIDIINREAWGETGRSLDKIIFDDDAEKNEQIKEQIRTYSFALYNKARQIVRDKSNTRKIYEAPFKEASESIS